MTQKAYITGNEFPELQKDKLRLYSMRFCPFAERTRLVLAHKQIPYETININLKRKPDWFFEKNPLGKVPVLQLNDQVLYESAICSEYLDEKYPDKPLLPKDPYEKARNKIVMEHYSKFVINYYKFLRCNDNEEKETIISEMIEQQCMFDKELGDKEYFGGSEPCMLDYYMFPWYDRIRVYAKYVIERMNHKYPRMGSWIEAMRETAAVKETTSGDALLLQFLEGYVKGEADPDVGL